jgi:hypothetical protein
VADSTLTSCSQSRQGKHFHQDKPIRLWAQNPVAKLRTTSLLLAGFGFYYLLDLDGSGGWIWLILLAGLEFAVAVFGRCW